VYGLAVLVQHLHPGPLEPGAAHRDVLAAARARYDDSMLALVVATEQCCTKSSNLDTLHRRQWLFRHLEECTAMRLQRPLWLIHARPNNAHWRRLDSVVGAIHLLDGRI